LFVVERDGARYFTRDGSFRQNEDQDLVTINGERLMGFGVDEAYNVIEGALAPVNIPTGAMTIAEETDNVRLSGNLDASGDLSMEGSVHTLMGTEDDGLRLISTATVAPADPANVLETSSLLLEIEDPDQPGSDLPLFGDGQQIEVEGVERGGKLLPTSTFLIGATSTIQDLMDFLTSALGLHAATNGNGSVPGVALDPTSGVLTITGNHGRTNDLDIERNDLRVLDPDGSQAGSPLTIQKAAAADGESVRTTFLVYDSLGTPLEVDATLALEATSDSGTTWRYFLDSSDDTDASAALATGLVSFDTNGRLVTTDPIPVSLDRAATGAFSPMTFNLSFQGDEDAMTALTDQSSEIAMTFRDGAPIGSLTDFGIGTDGTITGAFSNGLTRTLGRVPLAVFTNVEGLVDAANNLYTVGPNSGAAAIVNPGSFGSGQIVSGSLELSNVDLGKEFIDLILSSTGYSASSRVIRTTDELMQQLLVLGR
ncbi:MAG: flagellar hook-basal body complex protein, partial [Phycisphaerales bacterium]|nr:flagellar hook-basal body complex protein [Phycisphaerales bacterium]